MLTNKTSSNGTEVDSNVRIIYFVTSVVSWATNKWIAESEWLHEEHKIETKKTNSETTAE